MSSIVRVTKNKQVYLYESRSYWDKDKKAPRTKMIYLGKENPATKEIIPPWKEMDTEVIKRLRQHFLA